MSIYTRRGDEGTTSLGDGARVPKDSARVETYGTLDEAISLLGLAACDVSDESLKSFVTFAQHRLMNCAGAVALPVDDPNVVSVTAEDVAVLERFTDKFTEVSGPMRGFILPGGCETASRLHVARTVVRRAERRLAALARDEAVGANVQAFVNRLSDALFAAARYANIAAGHPETMWDAHYRAE